MNCVNWEERIALYAGGDLAPVEAQAVERHVAECAGCHLLLSGLRESLGLLREAHAEPIGEAHFAAVRARVLSELGRGPARGWRWAWIYAPWVCTAAAVVLLLAVWPGPVQHMVVPMPAAPVAPVVAKVIPNQVVANRVVSIHAAPLYPKISEAKGSETVLVKLETDDPDVVIYWIAETKGETK